MSTFLMPPGRARGWSNAGVPAAGCKLYTYEAGTSTPKVTYQDAEGTIPHENPITLDSKGEALIYWDGNYKIDLRTAAGVQITGYPIDNYETPMMPGALSASAGAGLMGFVYENAYNPGTIGKWVQDLGASSGSNFIGFSQSGAGTVVRTLESEMRERVSVTQFGADATGVADSTDAFNAAPSGSFVPPGTYKFTAHITGKTYYSQSDVATVGNGSANIINLIESRPDGFAVIDQVAYAGLEYKSEPTIVVAKTGKVIAVYRIGESHVNGATNVTSYLVWKEYDKQAGTWGALQVLDSQSGFDTRNQIVGMNENTGRLFCIYVQNQYLPGGDINEATRKTFLKYSDDNGNTWSARVDFSAFCPFPTLDNVPFGKIISFADGKLLMTIYNYHTIVVMRSIDNGLTWVTHSTVYTTPIISDDNITEPTLVKVSDTNLVCIARCIPMGLVGDGTVTWEYLGRKWAATTAYEVDRVVYDSGKVYLVTTAGTSGAVAPSHSSGSVANGTTVMLYLGAYTVWGDATSYASGAYVETFSAYLYRCKVAGVSASQPFYNTLDGNETQLAYFKSDNAGATWSDATKVTWTNDTYRVTTSPPSAVVVGSEVHISWFSRSPEWTAYHVRMQARAFFENPAWAFAKVDGEPRSRLMRSLLFAQSNNYPYRIDCGYIHLTQMPNSRDVMATWYDLPSTAVPQRVHSYSTIIQG